MAGIRTDARLVAYYALGVLAWLFAALAWLFAALSWRSSQAWMRCEVWRMKIDPWLEVSEELT